MDIMQKFTEVSQGERVELPVALRLPQDLDFLQSWQYYIEHDMDAMNAGKGSVFRPLNPNPNPNPDPDPNLNPNPNPILTLTLMGKALFSVH